MTCTCGAADRGEGGEAHAADCRIRTGFVPNTELDTGGPSRRYVMRHNRPSWYARLRVRRPVTIGALNAIGLGSFAISAAMLSPIAGVAIFGVGCLVYAWLLDDG